MEIKNSYGFWTKIRLGWWLLRSKCIDHRVRLIRFPFDIRGCKYIDLGSGLTTGVGCRLEAFSPDGGQDRTGQVMRFGKNVQINDYVHISAMRSVKIGDNVLMAGRIYISDNSHGFYRGTQDDSSPDTPPAQRPYFISPVFIGDNVWLGEGVVVMPGVNIGEGSVIGSNSVVTKSIPPFCIAVGTPAKVIKIYNHTKMSWERE